MATPAEKREAQRQANAERIEKNLARQKALEEAQAARDEADKPDIEGLEKAGVGSATFGSDGSFEVTDPIGEPQAVLGGPVDPNQVGDDDNADEEE